MERRRALGGSIPKRIVRPRKTVGLPLDTTFEELRKGSANQAVSTTMGFTRLLRNLARDENIGQYVVPIIPDEGRTFGMDSLFPELKIYASQGQKYQPVDHDMLLSYSESAQGQILEEGITEAGFAGQLHRRRLGLRDPRRADDSVLHVLFDVRLPARRRPDLASRRCARTRLPARRNRWPHDVVGRRSAAPGRSLAGARQHRAAVPGVRPGVRVRSGSDHAGRHHAHVRHRRRTAADVDRDVFYYLTLYNENYPMPAMPADLDPAHIVRGLYRWKPAAPDTLRSATVLFSGSAQGAAHAAVDELAKLGIGVELWSATSYKALRDDALGCRALEPTAPQPAATRAAGHAVARRVEGPDHRRHRLHEDRARADRALPARPQRSCRWAPTAWAAATPAMRCATTSRSTPATSCSPCCRALAAEGLSGPAELQAAIEQYGIDPEASNPAVV